MIVEGTQVTGVRRMGKRIVIALQGELFLLFYLMVAGRWRWCRQGATIPKSNGLAAFDFENGTLLVTEASKKKRASLHVVKGEDALASFEYGGVEVFDVGPEEFRRIVYAENECNYCACCRTGGRLSADRALAPAQGQLAEDAGRVRSAQTFTTVARSAFVA